MFSGVGARGATAKAAVRWLLPRLCIRAGLLVLVLGLVFAAMDTLPGDAASTILGSNRTPAQLAALEHSLGLGDPWAVRFWHWTSNALTGDFGTSVHGRETSELLAAALPVTLTTTGMAFLITLVSSTLVAIWWAVQDKQSKGARVADWISVFLISIPEFVIGVFLVAVFALWLRVLPAVTIVSNGLPTEAFMYVLPVIALSIPQIAWNSRVLHSALVDLLSSSAVKNAELNGIVGRKLMMRHVLPLAMPSFAASMATSAGVLVAGTITVEALFNHPGIGLLVANAVNQRDITVLVAALSVTGVAILALLTIADAVRVIWTPKVNI